MQLCVSRESTKRLVSADTRGEIISAKRRKREEKREEVRVEDPGRSDSTCARLEKGSFAYSHVKRTNLRPRSSKIQRIRVETGRSFNTYRSSSSKEKER